MSKSMRRKVASVLSTAMIVGSMPLAANVVENNEGTYVKEVTTQTTSSGQVEVEQGTQKIFDVSALENGTLKADIACGDFTIKATSGKTVTIEANEQTSEYHHSLKKRLKLGGAGDTTYRSVEFKVNGPAEVTLYALSSGSGNRPICIYDAQGNVVAELTAYDSSKIEDTDKKLPAQTATLDAAGTYYIYSTKSVNLYYASVTEGQVNEPTLDNVMTPKVSEVNNNAEDGAKVDILVQGEIINSETDRLWVKLYDAKGTLVTSTKVSELTDGKATVTLSPGKSGDYKIICDAIRAGVKESISSEALEEYIRIPLGEVNFTNVKTGKNNTLNVDWDDVRSAVTYDVYIREEGKDEELVQKGLTKSECTIENLTPGTKYIVRVVATDLESDSVEKTVEKVLAEKEERFMSALVGSGASGNIIENADGSVKMEAIALGTGSGGKLADSEDGFLYYYTEIDPETENFTLTATFHVDDAASKDNQSGFGVMAIDTFEAGNSSARYFNSAGAVLRKYIDDATNGSVSGIPGGYFITGYTGKPTSSSGSRKRIDTAPFDWNFNADKVPSGPRFATGEEYTLTLRKSNTGFHASMIDPRTGETTEEVICYEPELLLQQDKDKYYVGVVVSRKITVTVKDINFTTITPEEDEPKQERPMSYKETRINLDSSKTTGTADYEAGFTVNYAGTIDVVDSTGKVVAENIEVRPVSSDKTFRAVADLKLNKGSNTYTAIYTPYAKEQQGELLGKYEDLASYEPVEMKFTVDYKTYGTEANAIYVSPTATSSGKGTKASPLDIYTAVNYAQPGQEIVLLGGTYKLEKGIKVNRGHNGTADNPIVLMSNKDERAVLDFTGCADVGITLGGDYWHVYDMEVMNTGKAGVHITGNHNIAEKLTVHGSGNTGIQISGSSTEENTMWPSNNLVQSCESYNNCDASANDADGFAAKLTVGEGNVFRYCISHHNIDDGWDLYAKSTTGPIGKVVVEKSVAYANGKLTEGDLIGEGNGFKLGGESMPAEHLLKDSISFDNLANGVFSNSSPNCQVENVISFSNQKNLFFNKTNYEKASSWKIDNYIGYQGEDADEIVLKNQDSLESTTNYLNGENITGNKVQDDWFESLEAVVPTIAADGSIDMGNFLKLTSNAPTGVGTIFEANPNPTVITIGKEIVTSSSSGGSSGSGSSSSSNNVVDKITSTVMQKVEAAIKDNKIPFLQIGEDNKITLDKEAIQKLLDSKVEVTIGKDGITITINNTLLKDLASKDKAMNVEIKNTSEADYKKVQEALNTSEALKFVGDRNTTMEVAVTTDKAVTNFTEPAKVNFDLSKLEIKDASKLTLVRYEIATDGTVKTVKLGGKYDEKTKTFTGRVDQTGKYAVVNAKELLKINMTIGDKTSVVNDSNLGNDIAPQIINGSTMVPVRFIAENLGAEVKWDSKKKQVNINLNGDIVTVSSNDGMLLKDSRTLVPIRYVSENLGANVLWVGSTKEIEIVK